MAVYHANNCFSLRLLLVSAIRNFRRNIPIARALDCKVNMDKSVRIELASSTAGDLVDRTFDQPTNLTSAHYC
jgi:hypothetical protein